MYFKLSNKNPFRDLVRNVKKIATTNITEAERISAYKELHKLLTPRLSETERFLNSQTAFSKRAEHWNMRNIDSIRRVTNMKNPWLAFKRKFDDVVNDANVHKYMSIELAWLERTHCAEDWLND